MQRTIGITRVSEEGDRETIHSYATQATRIERDCEQKGAKLLYIGRERNISGGSDLSDRPELSRAVAAVEAGEADVIVAAYFDRFFRSLEVQGEVIRRIERAGGEVLTLDHGTLTNATPAKRLQANIVGAMAQYFREQTAEKTGAAQAAAVARGVMPWPIVPGGYVKGAAGVLTPDTANAAHVARAFAMRLDGHTIKNIRAYLNANGVDYGYHGVCKMLKNRIYLGELHFGKLVNLQAHEPLVDRGLFDAVQRMVIIKGRQAKSDRLLARLGVLRCATCNGALIVNTSGNDGTYPVYRCPTTGDCPKRVTISALIVENMVIGYVKRRLRDIRGTATAADGASDAIDNLDRAQQALDAAITTFASIAVEPAVIAKLKQLADARDVARDAYERAAADQNATTIAVTVGDWDQLTLEERRALIKAVIGRVAVAPGRGPDPDHDRAAIGVVESDAMRKRSREPTESASQLLGLNVSGGHERLPSYLRRMLTLRLPPLQDTLELAAPRIANRDAGEPVRDVLRGLVGGFPRYLLARR